MQASLRDSGLQAVEHLSWGSHFCQFYNTKQDLVETLVPYFSAGLRANESCLWITSEPLEAEEAKALMVRAVPEFRGALAKGQIEIHDLTDWYVPGNRFDADAVLAAWIEREQRALREGYAGLRLTGNTFWLERAGWSDFMDYERRVNGTFGRHQVLGLCTYCLERCTAQDVLDVVATHQFALARRGGSWHVLETASAERNSELEGALRGRDDFLAMLAHELRNPLAPIRSVAEVMRKRAPGDEQLASLSGIIERQVAHLARVLDELVDPEMLGRMYERFSEPPAPRATARRRVLIVDDNADAGHTLAMALELMGHEAQTALDGETGLAAAARFRPDVVLLDIALPGADGYEVVRRMRRMPELAETRIAALTGHGQKQDRRKGLEAGFDEYFVKPVAPETLSRLLYS